MPDKDEHHEESNTGETLETGILTEFGPVTKTERIVHLDVLRGVAVLGILVINMPAFAFPFVKMMKPLAGDISSLDLATWWVSFVFFLQKFMAIFSMLFGAGIILMYNRARQAGVEFGRVYYRRMIILLLVGLAHAYLLWWGDILFYYAVLGLILYVFRRKSARFLITFGIVVYLVGLPVFLGVGLLGGYLKSQAEAAAEIRERGERPDDLQLSFEESWQNMKEFLAPTQEMIDEEIEIYGEGSYGDIFGHRWQHVLMMHLSGFIMFFIWRIGGFMLIGMGLMKLGVFTGDRSLRFYVIMGLICYIVGLVPVIYGATESIRSDFDGIVKYSLVGPLNYAGSILVSLGHVCLVMIFSRKGLFGWLKRRLAAVGRMALTNYLLPSIIMTTIFYGYGLGYFGQVSRFHQIWFMLGMWIIQLGISPIWLKHFGFGPAEWLWRSLTYRKRQPMRVG